MSERAQESLDRFYVTNGPCCAGCDWWRYFNSMVGECHKSAPMDGEQRWGMLHIENVTLPVGAGHVMTKRDHCCGDFKDDFNWAELEPHYLRRIGRTPTPKAGD